MAGDYEYFAAQGRHPFVFALAEFIDNSLRATRRNAPHPRQITVSLVVSGSNPATARGLVCVTDNGVGMNKQELNDWVGACGLGGCVHGGRVAELRISHPPAHPPTTTHARPCRPL